MIEFADKIDKDDKVFVDQGVTLIVNPKSYAYLKEQDLIMVKRELMKVLNLTILMQKILVGAARVLMFNERREKKFFDLFDLPVSVDVNIDKLEINYKKLQKGYTLTTL